MTKRKISIYAPATPGAAMTLVGTTDTVAHARVIAALMDDRRDLVGQDVRIEWTDSGQLIEYGGPNR